MRRAHLADDLRSDRRVTQAGNPSLEAVVLYPEGHGGVQTRRAGRVGVHVGCYANARRACGIDHVDYLVELAPVIFAGELEMIDFRGGTTCLGNVDGFLDGRFDAVTF